MHIDLITVVPGLLEGPFSHSILKRAEEKGIATVRIHNLRDYATGKQKQVDDYAFGGGAGMVLMIEPIARCIEALQKERVYDEIIYMTPDGETFDQPMANSLSQKKNLLILCGHYKGVDQRVRDAFITKEISIGDYVLSGGELAAAVVADALIRLIPGVLNDETSALTDSFQDNFPDTQTDKLRFCNFHKRGEVRGCLQCEGRLQKERLPFCLHSSFGNPKYLQDHFATF